MNYNDFAATYAQTRWARDWLVDPLHAIVRSLPPSSRILEIGCGTGNYTLALQQRCPHAEYFGFDLSEEMLQFAKTQAPAAHFCTCNADERFPYADDFFAMAFLVDVIHHIINYTTFFSECYRITRPGGTLAVTTDSEQDVERRSLSKFFPETTTLDKKRSPSLPVLKAFAARAGFQLTAEDHVEGSIPIDAALIDKFAKKCSSSLRLLTEKEVQDGIGRLKSAERRAEQWLSSYTILQFVKSDNRPRAD